MIRVRDGGLFPTAPDIRRMQRAQAETGVPHVGLTADVQEAHRAVANRREDWPLQACRSRPDGDVFLSKCGMFGVSSAAYWWGRLGAALLRSCLYVTGRTFPCWIMLFADDWDLSSGGRTSPCPC